MSESGCRKTVSNRSGGLCEKCGRPGTDMHHRKSRSQGGKWNPANVIHLCRDCHAYMTTHPLKGYQGGWMIKGFQSEYDSPLLRWGTWVFIDDDGEVKDALDVYVQWPY
ncbi:HNH endonuclease [Gordonia phage Fryberger]|uniref:HNH endonuclease n=1 Tax=Gordonia phage Fryberger TaxID=2250392 RepID=A0A346FCP8_9CAUD|nr:HNH endonuclease [Gordonia phage Fryberger]AXN53512.1 HNH endonuclease [Gordonia phage Fryberger]